MNPQLRADLRGIYVIWRRDVHRFTRDRMRMIAAMAQPLLFLFILGSGLSGSVEKEAQLGDASYKAFLFPGVVGMSLLFTAVFSAMSIVWDREFGFLKEVLVAPVSRWAVAVGKAIGGATQALMQGFILLMLAPVAGVPLTLMLLAQMLPIMALLAFAMTLVGIVIATKMKTMESFQMVMNFVVMPMFFLSGALYPLRDVPGWLAALTHLDPVTYGVDPLRQVVALSVTGAAFTRSSVTLLGYQLGILEELGILAAFALFMLVSAIRAFQIQE